MTTPDPASTCILLHGGDSALQVLMLQRAETLAFLPGAFVFPGGRLEAQDARVIDQGLYEGALQARHAEAMGLPLARARQFMAAAIRELFEETGVLLARPSAGPLPPPIALADGRRLLESGTVGWPEWLKRHRLVLDFDQLSPWAWWTTPPHIHRRFDTRFFLTRLPPGQIPELIEGEAVAMRWIEPAQVVLDDAFGERLAPPTRVTLVELSDYATPQDAWNASASGAARVSRP